MHLLSLDPEDAEATTVATSLAAWWKHVGALLARGLPRHVTLTTDLPEELPPVSIPPHRLTQAVLNLVVNAGEAVGEQGEVRIWAEDANDGREVRLGVTDNGPGMSPEVRRRAMDPFFTTKKRGLGTGLGLSLVQGVVRSAGGSVNIESSPGHGTTIVLLLPTYHPSRAMTVTGPVRVALTVADPRVSTLVQTILASAGLGEDSVEPEQSDLWITDGTAETLAIAPAHLQHDSRRMLVLGGDQDWSGLGVAFVQDPSDFEALRENIHQAVAEARSRPPAHQAPTGASNAPDSPEQEPLTGASP